MKKLYHLCLIALLALVFMAPPASAQLEEFSVGAILPLTGSWQSIGSGANAALELASTHIETYLNPLGYTMNVVIKDTQSDPAKALEELKNLHDMGIRIVVGPMTSDEAEALIGYATENDMLLVSPSSSSEELGLKDNLFRLAPTDSIQAAVLTYFLASYDISTIIPIYIDDNYGKSFYEILNFFTSIFGIYNYPEPFTFATDTTDFSSIIQEVENTLYGLDVSYPYTGIFFIGNEDHIKNMIQQIPEFSPLRYIQWFANEAVIGSGALLEDETTANFLYRTSFTGSSLDTRDAFKDVFVEDIYQQLAAALGTQPSYYSLLTYDALWLVSRLYNKEVGRVDFPALKESLSIVSNHFYGLSGMAQFDVYGDKNNFTYAFQQAGKWNGSNIWDTMTYFTYNGGYIYGPDRDYSHEGYRSYVYNPYRFVPDELETVHIGALLPLTGSLSSHGIMAEQSLQASLTTINQIFSARKYNIQFELLVKDTQTDPDVALQEAKILHEQGVQVLIGPLASSCLSHVEDYVAENDLILISPTSTAVSLAKEDHIVRISPNDSTQTAAVLAYLEKKEIDTLLILHREDTYGKDFAAIVSESFEGDLLTVQSYPAGTTDFSTVLQTLDQSLQLTELENTAVLALGFDELASCIGQIPEDSFLLEIRWIGTDGFANNQSVIDNAQIAETASNIDLTCSSLPGDFMVFSVRSQILLHEMAALDGTLLPELTSSHANAYDALWMAANLYQSVGTGEKLVDEWAYFEYRFFENLIGDIRGTRGAMKFDENEDSVNYYYDFNSVVKNEGGDFKWKKTGIYFDYNDLGPDLLLFNSPNTAVANWSLF